MGVKRRLDEVYGRVPRLRCKGLCQDTCGPVPATRDEIRRMERSGGHRYGWELRTGHCTFLNDSTGRCTCYRDRPLICRVWGTVASSACPFGCEPDQWLTDEQFDELLFRMTEIGGPLMSPLPFVGDRPATPDEYRSASRTADALLARGLRLPDNWDASKPYIICPSCEWRAQTHEGVAPAVFVGEDCPHCEVGALRMAQPGDKPLFVPKARGS